MTDDEQKYRNNPRYILLERGELGHTTLTDAPAAIANGDWNKWAEWVKDGIRSNRNKLDIIEKTLSNVLIENRVQKIKFGMWGALGASLPTIAAFLILWMLGKL